MELVELSSTNYQELAKLKLSSTQEAYVFNFEKCLAYKKANPFLKIYGIKDECYVGLVAFARWDDPKIPLEYREVWLDEFYIAKEFQGKGYAKKALPLILAKMEELYHPRRIVLSVCYENVAAIKLYETFGFERTSYVYLPKSDEIVLKDSLEGLDEMMMYKAY